MRSALLRTPAVRQLTARRFASSTSNAASEVSAKAQDAGKKAQDVAKVAAEKLGAAASGFGRSLMKVGGRTGKLIHSANAVAPTVGYYSRVGLELSKLVFRGQGMTPPKAEIFKATFSPFLPIVKGLRTAPFATFSTLVSPRTVFESIQNVSRAQLAQSGVIAAEIIGFFTIGEIIGRRKLVGYRSNH